MRLAISLEKFGLIERRSDGSYQLGAETKRLGLVYEQAFDLERAITPVLEELSQRTEETASFYVPHAKRRLCLYRVESPQRLRVHVRPGDLRPMDQSAIARVLRAFGSSTQTASPPDIQVPLYSSGATDPHVAALAMPVFGEEGALLGAVALSGPVTRFTQERAEAVADLLCSAAVQITKSIGGRLEIPQATSTEAA